MKFLRNLFNSNSVEPLVLQDEVWKEVYSNLKAIGGGDYVLPSKNLNIIFWADDETNQNILNSAYNSGKLEKFLTGKLAEERCTTTLNLSFQVVANRPANWNNKQNFALNFGSISQQPPTVIIKILIGTASEENFTFNQTTINLGRGKQAKDKYDSVVRVNHVDFLDTNEGANGYVSQLHAQITYRDNTFYLSDSGFEFGRPTNGTRLFRQGNEVAKLNGDQKIPLQNGDEIHLGKAQIRFEIES